MKNNLLSTLMLLALSFPAFAAETPSATPTFNFKDGSTLHKADVKSPQGFFNTGFQDVFGQFVIPPKYNGAGDFSEGLAGVRVGQLWGYINPQGMMIIRPQFMAGGMFIDGRCLVKVKDNQWALIDKKGKILVTLPFRQVNEFSEGMAAVQKDYGAWGYLNAKGKLAIPLQFQDAGKFKDGLACVQSNSKYGYINAKGKFVIPAVYDKAQDFDRGVANAYLGNQADAVFIDRTGKTLTFQEMNEIRNASPKEKVLYVQYGPNTELRSAQLKQYFKAQPKRDELYKYSENSLLGSDYKPLAGEGVLLVAEIRQWNEGQASQSGPANGSNIVEFKVLSKNGMLLNSGCYPPTRLNNWIKPAPVIKVTGFVSNAALVWVVTDPGSDAPVTVKATLLAEGERGPFVGGHREDLFVVNPMPLPKDWKLDLPSVMASQKENNAPGRELASFDRAIYDSEDLNPKSLKQNFHVYRKDGKRLVEFRLIFDGKHFGPARIGPVQEEDALASLGLQPGDIYQEDPYFQDGHMTHINPTTGEGVFVGLKNGISGPVGPVIFFTPVEDFINFRIVNQQYPMLWDQRSILLAKSDGKMNRVEERHWDPQTASGHHYWTHWEQKHFSDYRDNSPNRVLYTLTTNLKVQ
jgi:hypothetical protein